jgi:tetratricopeptide (TPR) repeat protein
MAKDQQGLPLAGAPASAAAFDRAVADYWGLRGDPVETLNGALAGDPAFALGAIAIADLFLIGGFRGDHPEVVKALGAAEAAIGGASERERRHLAAAKAWATGRAFDAEQVWDDILADHPSDALALRLVEDAHFMLGHSLAIRDSAARVLPAWERDNPLTSFVLGAYAFGLEESGELERAEAVGREALAGNPADGWATHALAHVFETANRQEEGIAFLKSTRANWRPAHFMAGHNGWHLAAFQIELGRFDETLAEYDRFAAPRLADDLTLDRVDAASLLWRLELAGAAVGDRWRPVAEAWMQHVDDHVSAFNDLHLALAAARSSDAADALRARASLDAYQRHGAGDNHRVTVEVGRLLIDGMLAFGAGDYEKAIEALSSARHETIRIGGSHAQRDIIAQTLIVAAERAGRWRLARALLAERAAVRPTSRVKGAYERARANAA